MGAAFSPQQLHRMFEAFDRARRVSSEDPDTIASRIINAASVGITDVDALLTAAVKPVDGSVGADKGQSAVNGAGQTQPTPRR